MPVLRDMGKWNKENGRFPGKAMYYKNEDAVEKVIRYITRTRWNESQGNELIGYGGAGVSIGAPVEVLIGEFVKVQKIYNMSQGRRMIHEVYSLSDYDFELLNKDYALVDLLGRQLCAYYFALGYQIVYAVHWDMSKHVHIHLAINTVNFRTYKKFHSGGEDFKQRIAIFKKIFFDVVHLAQTKVLNGVVSPINFIA